MKLGNVARWADRTALYDAYDPTKFSMMAQISAYIDNQQDGAISKRRVISFAPTQQLPARRVVTYEGEVWIVGDTMKDMWKGKPIRVSAATKKSTGLCYIRQPGQAALDAGGVQAFGQVIYLKDTVNTTSTSAYSPQYEVHFSSTEQLSAGKVLVLPNNYLHVRSYYPILDGFVCAVSDELGPDARRPITYHARGAFNPATDSYPTTDIPTFAIALDYYKLYGKETALAYSQDPGDLTLLVAISVVTPNVGETLTMGGLAWRVLAVAADQDAYRLHIRRV